MFEKNPGRRRRRVVGEHNDTRNKTITKAGGGAGNMRRVGQSALPHTMEWRAATSIPSRTACTIQRCAFTTSIAFRLQRCSHRAGGWETEDQNVPGAMLFGAVGRGQETQRDLHASTIRWGTGGKLARDRGTEFGTVLKLGRRFFRVILHGAAWAVRGWGSAGKRSFRFGAQARGVTGRPQKITN